MFNSNFNVGRDFYGMRPFGRGQLDDVAWPIKLTEAVANRKGNNEFLSFREEPIDASIGHRRKMGNTKRAIRGRKKVRSVSIRP
jgi:hypothetical protein